VCAFQKLSAVSYRLSARNRVAQTWAFRRSAASVHSDRKGADFEKHEVCAEMRKEMLCVYMF
jgi:hypothetical protein